jgi:hypothetical protein
LVWHSASVLALAFLILAAVALIRAATIAAVSLFSLLSNLPEARQDFVISLLKILAGHRKDGEEP